MNFEENENNLDLVELVREIQSLTEYAFSCDGLIRTLFVKAFWKLHMLTSEYLHTLDIYNCH